MMGEWISVNERLPDINEHTNLSLSDEVLVYNPDVAKVGIAQFVRYEEEGITDWISSDGYMVHVTHWMPLPPPPEA